MNKDKVSPPLPAVPVDDDDVIKAQRRPLLAVMPADNNNKTTTTVADDPWIVLMVVCLWALFNSVLFTALDIATVILNLNPCTKSTRLFRCESLPEAAAEEMWFLLCGELLCSMAAEAALAVATLHMLLLTTRTTTTMSHWWAAAAAVHALAWVALAATVGMHCMKVASERILLAADPGRNTVHIAFGCVGLGLDLLAAGVLLCCSPPRRRLELLGEHQGGHDGEAV